MAVEILKERTLSRNSIKQFLLKVDLLAADPQQLKLLAEKCAPLFDRTESRLVKNFTIDFATNKSEVSDVEHFDFVLINDSKALKLVFSQPQGAFWIECNNYKNYHDYSDILNKVISLMTELELGFESRRIGMRFINDFRCETEKTIRTIFNSRLSTILKQMLLEIDHTRVIGVEEYIIGDSKMRLQYGIPNRFFPGLIKTYDLLLDIDSYMDVSIEKDKWGEVTSQLNHNAYERFIKEMNPKYLDSLK